MNRLFQAKNLPNSDTVNSKSTHVYFLFLIHENHQKHYFALHQLKINDFGNVYKSARNLV